MSRRQIAELAGELRTKMIRTVSQTGGHCPLPRCGGDHHRAPSGHGLAARPDRGGTGHQAYAHKLLTGRAERFGTLRQLDGIGGFPRRTESEHDVFDGGHAGTGVSIAPAWRLLATSSRPATPPPAADRGLRR